MPTWETKYALSYLSWIVGIALIIGGFAGYVYYGGILNTNLAAYNDYWYLTIGIGIVFLILGAYFTRPRHLRHRWQ